MKIAVLSSHTPSLFWFRLDMMRLFIEYGHQVFALGPEPSIEWEAKFKDNGIDYRQIFVERNGTNPFSDLRTYRDLYRFLEHEKPDKVFCYQAKTILYGSLAARFNEISDVYPLIAGLGSIFIGTGLKHRIYKTIIKAGYRMACSSSKKVFFQNEDDKAEFVKNGLVDIQKTVIINGSGVNLDKFRAVEMPPKPAFLLIGRLIKDKGIMEYLEACKVVRDKYPSVRCLLVGPYDSNPSALKPEDLQPYIDSGIIEYCGEQSDVRPYIAMCSTYVLPSYREGTPKTVLEAMAMGRAIITSNAPGCKETVIDGENGFLVKVKDASDLAEKMEYLILNPETCRIMGEKSLVIAKEKYDVNFVNQRIMEAMKLA